MLSTPIITSTNNANSTVPITSSAMVATAIIAPVVASHFAEEQMVMLTLNTIPFALPKMREQFRNYQDSARQAKVQATYSAMHATQTVEFVRAQHAKWLQFNHTRATIMQCLELLDDLVDDSDPDIALPNSVHAFQSAEMARRVFPEHDWFHLVALIHDLGKVMALWGAEQFATVGDTYPVGCKPDSSCVFLDTFAQCPDQSDERYNTELGMYQEHTGIDQLLMSWGHDEYMYRVLLHNGSRLPDVAHRIIRYHSFYPWHTHGGYRHLCNDTIDVETLQWVQRFNEFDLYTKSDEIPNVDSIKPYYQSLIDKYIPGTLEW